MKFLIHTRSWKKFKEDMYADSNLLYTVNTKKYVN